MDLLTIFLFLVYTWGLGFSVSSFLKRSDNFLERNLMNLGVGLGVFVVLGAVLNLLRIPLDWRIFLVLSLIYPLFVLVNKIRSKNFSLKFKLTKSDVHIFIVLVLFFVCLFMYAGGALKYHYLEDDDPWSHAVGVKYISIEKTANDAANFDFQYTDPYPPGYDLIMGVLHQTSQSMSWTLKFFNALILSLGIIFFYFFAKSFIGNKNKALFATFVLACIPSFFTHFIWSHSLVVILFFPALYCLEMIKHDKRWMIPSILVISSILLTQPTQAMKIGVMLVIYWGCRAITEKKLLKEELLSLVGGFLVSLVWWIERVGKTVSSAQGWTEASNQGLFAKVLSFLSPTAGTATRAYTFDDFFFAQPFGGINVHFGWGVVVSLLLVFGIVYSIFKYGDVVKKESNWILITILWFLFTFLGTNSMTFNLPIGLFAFRFWLLLAIPVALLSALGLWFLFGLGKKVGVPAFIILIVCVGGVLATSGYQKYNQNHNAVWPPGVSWGSNEEIQGFVWMKDNLPVNTKVFGICSDESSYHVVGFDMMDEVWNKEVVNFKKDALNKTARDVSFFLKSENYKYLVVDSRCVTYFGINQTNQFINDAISSSLFTPEHQTPGMILLRVL